MTKNESYTEESVLCNGNALLQRQYNHIFPPGKQGSNFWMYNSI